VRRGAGGAWRAGNTAPARIRIPARVVAAIERRVTGAAASQNVVRTPKVKNRI